MKIAAITRAPGARDWSQRGRSRGRLVALFALLLTLSGVAFRSAARASAAPISYIPITVNAANWSYDAGFGSVSPFSMVDSLGVVHLQGAAAQVTATGGDPLLLGTLPTTASPSHTVYTIVHTYGGTYADLSIAPNGQIRVLPSNNSNLSFVSLEGVNFYPGTGTAIRVNAANWSQNAGFGSVAPAEYRDSSGYVHLLGAASQVNATGGDPTLLGSLFYGQDIPCVDVYTVVHTYEGTYADLVINNGGEIRLIAPAGAKLSFVSLEGISYFPQEGCPDYWHAITLTPDWSGSAGYSSGVPVADVGPDGIVHLMGAVKRVSTSGDPNLIGTLDVGIRPARTVYTIVHTYGGTYADLSITPDGAVHLLPSSNTNASFVSLEGITYPLVP